MEVKPRKISEGIENTLEGFLNFLLRYFRTLWIITIAPHRSLSIAYESRKENSNSIHSLTFLAIGSFLFALLISVYPKGVLGVLDFVWFTDEITKNIGEKWQDALSPTKMIASGLPIILMISLCAVIVRKISLDKGFKTYLLFDVMCFAFGYQCALIFIMFSIESIIQALQIILFIPDINFSEDGGLQYGVMAFFILLVIAIIFIPAIMLSGAYTKLSSRKNWLHKKTSIYLFSFLVSMVIFSLYVNSASVPSSIKERVSTVKEPSASYLDPFKLVYNSHNSSLVFSAPYALDNPLTESLLIEMNSNELHLLFKKGSNENIDEYEFVSSGLKELGSEKSDKWALADPKKTTIIIGEYSMKNNHQEFCKALSDIKKYNDNWDISLYAKTNISFIGSHQDIEIETNISLADIELFIDDLSIGFINNENKKYNKYIKSDCATAQPLM